jgi:hypothetical protein
MLKAIEKITILPNPLANMTPKVGTSISPVFIFISPAIKQRRPSNIRIRKVPQK